MTQIKPKKKILDTALEMIEEQGYVNLNVNHLAERAGVAIGTLYWHFKRGKPDIVKEMVNKLDGTIQLKSDPDKGSEFTVRLPSMA